MTSSSDAGSLKRGVAFLKLLATGGARGCPLSELAEKSGVPHPSAHRILKQLIAERLVVHDAQTHRYRLGPLAFELGLAGSMLHDIRDLCEPAMAALSRETEDTAYLVVRSGFEAVCLHRLEGDFPIRTLVAWAPGGWPCWPPLRPRSVRPSSSAWRPPCRPLASSPMRGCAWPARKRPAQAWP